MAEGVLRHLALERGIELTVDSAGTADYHVGDAPDHRASTCAKRHGFDIDALRGRQVEAQDFHRFDRLLAMDRSNEHDLLRLAPDPALASKVKMMMDFARESAVDEVPDPYYGPDSGFEHVYDLLVDACNGMLDELQARR